MSGGTERTRTSRDGRQIDVYFARCTKCGAKHTEGATTTRAARMVVELLGWLVEQVRVPVFGIGHTNSWKVLCPTCRASTPPTPEKQKAPSRKARG